jgi:hypothetical protein
MKMWDLSGIDPFLLLVGQDNSGLANRAVKASSNLLFVAEGELGVRVMRARSRQRVSWAMPATAALADAIPVVALGSSGQALHVEVVRGAARIEGGKLIGTASGTVVLRASHPGTSEHTPVESDYVITFTESALRFSGISLEDRELVLRWTGGKPPFSLWRKDTLAAPPVHLLTTQTNYVRIPATGREQFFLLRMEP